MNALHTAYEVNERQCALLSALAELRTMIGILPTDELSLCLRGMRRAWNSNEPRILRDWLETVMVFAEDLEGAYGLYEKARDVSSMVLGLEVFS